MCVYMQCVTRPQHTGGGRTPTKQCCCATVLLCNHTPTHNSHKRLPRRAPPCCPRSTSIWVMDRMRLLSTMSPIRSFCGRHGPHTQQHASVMGKHEGAQSAAHAEHGNPRQAAFSAANAQQAAQAVSPVAAMCLLQRACSHSRRQQRRRLVAPSTI